MSAAALVLLGYISLFSIGLALLVLAIGAAGVGVMLVPSKIRLVIAVVEASLAGFPLAILVREVATR